MTWFSRLMGFEEGYGDAVYENIEVRGEYLYSRANGKQFRFGRLEVPTLASLRSQVAQLPETSGELTIHEVIGDVKEYHIMPSNAGALFQAASQFNLLEMVAPTVTPEAGVSGYEHDHTQGPACAIACGAGTIYRNYFAEVNGEIGQTADNQIDCLDELGRHWDNEQMYLWDMRNGYAFCSESALEHISEVIEQCTPEEYEALLGKLKIGIQWNAEVTYYSTGHSVTQAYCSGLPVGYSDVEPELWEAFARLVLDATYEATFSAALLNYHQTGNPRLFLTLVGGGVFGNRPEWIQDAIRRSVMKFKRTPLQVKIVSYGSSSRVVRELLKSLNLS